MARRAWLGASALLLACACYRHTAMPVPVAGPSQDLRLARARVTLRSGQLLRMEHVYVRGDSLRTDKPFTAVALSDITRLEAVEFSKGETARWTVIIGGSMILALIALMFASDPDS